MASYMVYWYILQIIYMAYCGSFPFHSEQDQMFSIQYESILQWLQTGNGLMSYPNSRDAIASKNSDNHSAL